MVSNKQSAQRPETESSRSPKAQVTTMDPDDLPHNGEPEPVTGDRLVVEPASLVDKIAAASGSTPGPSSSTRIC